MMMDGHPNEAPVVVDARRAANEDIDLARVNGAPYDTIDNSTIILLTMAAAVIGGILLDCHATWTGFVCESLALLGVFLMLNRIICDRFK